MIQGISKLGVISRRRSRQYPLVAQVQYRLRDNSKRTGYGWTVMLSSAAVLFEAEEALPFGVPIELLIDWPIALDDKVGLRLWIKGAVAGIRVNLITVQVVGYEYRTKSLVSRRQDDASAKTATAVV